MNKKTLRLTILGAVFALSLGGFFLRRHHLAVGFDAMGLSNGKGIVGLILLCAVAVVGSIIVALTTEKREGVAESFSADKISLPLYFGAGGLTAVASVVGLINPVTMGLQVTLFSRLTSAVGVAAGFSMVAVGVGQKKKQSPSALAWMLPVAYYILQILLRFRMWSADPMVLDYAFKLFSLLGAMLTSCFMAGFAVGEGKGRTSLCFSIIGMVFSAITLAEGGFGNILLHGAIFLFCLASAWQLLGEKE
ncbi:MAG: hypothetical protein J6K84_00420 [Oscillospiraceae bacterium]|nr:hypothetical protein [Oscillospiraceae bacterium]